MKASLNALHHQSNDWLRELEFYKDDLAILTKRLEEVASANSEQAVLAQVEHFQNKFVMLREQLDTLKHDINAFNHGITEISKTKPDHVDEKIEVVPGALHQKVKNFSHSLADTRFEFNAFLSKTL